MSHVTATYLVKGKKEELAKKAEGIALLDQEQTIQDLAGNMYEFLPRNLKEQLNHM